MQNKLEKTQPIFNYLVKSSIEIWNIMCLFYWLWTVIMTLIYKHNLTWFMGHI
jgi:hypothetical protein